MAFKTTAAAVMSLGVAGLAAPASADVTLGFLGDLSGATSALTGEGAFHAMNMAIEDFGGEVNGETIKVLKADHLGKPDVGLGIAREWIDQQGVNMMTPVDNSAVALAISDLIRDRDVAMFTGASNSKLINENCGPTQQMMLLDTTALARAITVPQVESGKKKWFFITVDYALGHDLQAKGEAGVTSAGGEVVGSAIHSPQTTDFSSFLLQAQASGADTIGMATFGSWQNAIAKQAQEFGIEASLSPYYLGITDINSTGLDTLQNISGAIQFYWDENDATRAFAKRFQESIDHPPTFTNAYSYEFTRHYLKGVEAVGSTDAKAVVAWMRDTPMETIRGDTVTLREDGATHREVLTYETKTPEQSTGDWDFLELTGTVSGDAIITPLSESICQFVNKS